jgi:hypothetical protein
MNTLKFIIVVSMALLATDLIYHQVVNSYVPTNEEIRQICFEEMVKADEMVKARGENNSILDSMMPLNSRVDQCVNVITQGLNAQGITIR